MGIIEKIQNKLSDLHDDICFLYRKEVSWRFKILNILSGDRLRFDIACTLASINELKTNYEHKLSLIETNKDISKEELILYYKSLDWKIKRVRNEIIDIWEL